MRPVRLIPFILAAAATASAQYVESIEVRVVNVDVVVTDRSGRLVPGLTKDDFELYENGKKQTITNFYEIRDVPAEPVPAPSPAGTATAQPPDQVPEELRVRRIAVFVDQEGIDFSRRRMAFEAIERAASSLMRPGDLVSVNTWLGGRKVLASMTSDRQVIAKALRDAATQSTGTFLMGQSRERVVNQAAELLAFSRANPRLLPIDRAYEQAMGNAISYADALYASQRTMAEGLRQTVASMAGLDGKKVMIFVGSELQRRPGLDVIDMVDSMYRPYGIKSSPAMLRHTDRNLGNEIASIARDANAAGVTMYTIDAADRSSRSAAVERQEFADPTPEFMNDSDSALSLLGLARATGGTGFIRTSDFDSILRSVVGDLSMYYSLGYHPEGKDGERKLVVKVKNPELRVRSRASYELKSAEAQMNDRVVANIFNPVTSQMKVRLSLGAPEADGDVFKVPVTVEFPAGELTTIPNGPHETGEFAIYFVTASAAGQLSSVVKDVRQFQYPTADATQYRRQPILYTVNIRVREGEQIMSAAVLDKMSERTGFARKQFVAP